MHYLKREEKLYGLSNDKLMFYQSRIVKGNNSLKELLGAPRQSSMFSDLCRKAPRSAIGAHYFGKLEIYRIILNNRIFYVEKTLLVR